MLFSLLSSLLIGFAAWVAYLRQWSSSAVTSLAVVVIACVAFVGAYYVFAKLVGLMIVRRAISAASLETYEERVSFVRAQMRTWGFACLLFGGVLQIPLIMVFN